MDQIRRKTILLIEDDPSILEVMKLSLEIEGFHVYAASEGGQALEILSAVEAPSLIFMDLSMPGMDGIEFRKIQQSNPKLAGIPVVVMSGAVDVESQIPPQSNVSYLPKPIALDQFLGMAKRFCA